MWRIKSMFVVGFDNTLFIQLRSMWVMQRWVKLSGTELLLGDVVSIGRSSGQSGEDKSVPADMLILPGSAIVNEAILTDESTPQWKRFQLADKYMSEAALGDANEDSIRMEVFRC